MQNIVQEGTTLLCSSLKSPRPAHPGLELDSYDVADLRTSINPAEATNAILPVVSWGKLAAKDVATPPPCSNEH